MINRARLQVFLGRAVADLGAALGAALVVIGDRLGLYRAMAGAGLLTAADLAARTGTVERYVREWLVAQAAGGYVEYDPATDRFLLPDEQASVLAGDEGPVSLPGAFGLAAGLVDMIPRVTEAFRGGGVPYAEYPPAVFEGIERFSQPVYERSLFADWIPALPGVPARLAAGGAVADVGCGRGATTLILARGFPAARVTGFDLHEPSVLHARRAAAVAGLADRVRFEMASATDFPGAPYDLVTTFDCLHDMADPVAAARHMRAALAPDGAWLIVEPGAADGVDGNLTPLGRVLASLSTLHCLPVSLADGGAGLGGLAGESKLREVVLAGGFGQCRRVGEAAFSIVLEARL